MYDSPHLSTLAASLAHCESLTALGVIDSKPTRKNMYGHWWHRRYAKTGGLQEQMALGQAKFSAKGSHVQLGSVVFRLHAAFQYMALDSLRTRLTLFR